LVGHWFKKVRIGLGLTVIVQRLVRVNNSEKQKGRKRIPTTTQAVTPMNSFDDSFPPMSQTKIHEGGSRLSDLIQKMHGVATKFSTLLLA